MSVPEISNVLLKNLAFQMKLFFVTISNSMICVKVHIPSDLLSRNETLLSNEMRVGKVAGRGDRRRVWARAPDSPVDAPKSPVTRFRRLTRLPPYRERKTLLRGSQGSKTAFGGKSRLTRWRQQHFAEIFSLESKFFAVFMASKRDIFFSFCLKFSVAWNAYGA